MDKVNENNSNTNQKKSEIKSNNLWNYRAMILKNKGGG